MYYIIGHNGGKVIKNRLVDYYDGLELETLQIPRKWNWFIEELYNIDNLIHKQYFAVRSNNKPPLPDNNKIRTGFGGHFFLTLVGDGVRSLNQLYKSFDKNRIVYKDGQKVKIAYRGRNGKIETVKVVVEDGKQYVMIPVYQIIGDDIIGYIRTPIQGNYTVGFNRFIQNKRSDNPLHS